MQKINHSVLHDILYNPELSWGAKGLWVYLISKPSGESLSLKNIVAECKNSFTATNNLIKELVELGLVERKIVFTKDGKKCFYNVVKKGGS